MEECRRLFEHIRENPADAKVSPQTLAALLSVDVRLVQRFLDALPDSSGRRSPLAPHVLERGKSGFWGPPLFRDWVSFLVLTSVFILLLDLIVGVLQNFRINLAGFVTPGAVAIGVLVVAIQMVCLYWHGMARKGLFAAIICGALLSLMSSTSFKGGFHFTTPSLLLTFMLVVTFAVIAVPVSTIGAYANLQRDLAFRDHLSRQELLDRLLGIRDLLSGGRDRETSPVARRTRDWMNVLRQRFIPVSFAMGVVVSLSTIVPIAILDPKGLMMKPETANQASPALLLLFLGAFAIGFLTQLFLGFLSGGPVPALKAMGAFCVASFMVYLLPIGPFGIQSLTTYSIGQYAISYGLIFLAGVVGGLGASVDRGASRRQLVQSQDPVALHAEMLDLEWKLRPQTRRVCVMVVDAERSSLMKSESDPLEAEWTFREYQKFLARVAGEQMGTVHSTAGDGAVIGFTDIASAFAAATQIQAEIHDFNAKTNRLKRPFRLRIGLHVGEVQGELDKVQFTAVIDIAAHIEKVCTAGGIAMSEPVAAELPHVSVHLITPNVDGFGAFGCGVPRRNLGFEF